MDMGIDMGIIYRGIVYKEINASIAILMDLH